MKGKNVKKDLLPKNYDGEWCNLVNKPCISEKSRDCTYCIRNTATNYIKAKENVWIH